MADSVIIREILLLTSILATLLRGNRQGDVIMGEPSALRGVGAGGVEAEGCALGGLFSHKICACNRRMAGIHDGSRQKTGGKGK